MKKTCMLFALLVIITSPIKSDTLADYFRKSKGFALDELNPIADPKVTTLELKEGILEHLKLYDEMHRITKEAYYDNRDRLPEIQKIQTDCKNEIQTLIKDFEVSIHKTTIEDTLTLYLNLKEKTECYGRPHSDFFDTVAKKEKITSTVEFNRRNLDRLFNKIVLTLLMKVLSESARKIMNQRALEIFQALLRDYDNHNVSINKAGSLSSQDEVKAIKAKVLDYKIKLVQMWINKIVNKEEVLEVENNDGLKAVQTILDQLKKVSTDNFTIGDLKNLRYYADTNEMYYGYECEEETEAKDERVRLNRIVV